MILWHDIYFKKKNLEISIIQVRVLKILPGEYLNFVKILLGFYRVLQSFQCIFLFVGDQDTTPKFKANLCFFFFCLASRKFFCLFFFLIFLFFISKKKIKR